MFPQTKASTRVQRSQDFWRLQTDVLHHGEVYEIDTSAKVFAIGPESDVPRVQLAYFDPQQQGQVSLATVSIEQPFIGRLDALLGETFPAGRVPGQILATPDILLNPNHRSRGITTINESWILPRFDLLGYIREPNHLPTKRSDFVHRGNLWVREPDSGGTAEHTILVPWYGRRFFEITFQAFDPQQPTENVEILGATFTRLKDGQLSEEQIIAPAVMNVGTGTGELTRHTVKASNDGRHDYIVVRVTGDDNTASAQTNDLANGPIVYTIRTSDEE